MVESLYAAADALTAFASFWLARQIRLDIGRIRPLYAVSNYPWIIPLLVAIWVGVGWITGLYREAAEEGLRRALAGSFKVAVLATLFVFAFVFALKLQYISRTLLVLYALVDFALMVAFRVTAGRLRISLAGCRHFLIVGNTRDSLEIARAIEANELRGMRLAGFASVAPQAESVSRAAPPLQHTYPTYAVRELPGLLARHVIDEVIFTVSKDELDQLEDTFLVCEQEGVKTRLALSFFPHTLSKVSLERLREMPLLTFSTTPENEYLMLLKRLVDFVMAAMMVTVLSPLFVTLSILVKLTSNGPIFYRQTRCGLGGRKFTLYKFRSMKHGAELYREDLEALNELDGPVFKIKNDPRCTPLGRLMRKLSLDELPQLFNILAGDMSFVGPRPPLPEEVQKYELWQRRRLRMQPGLTCLWAIEGRNRLNFKRWMELDLEYIDRWSLLLDWKILLKTIPAVLLGKGAF